MSSCKGLIVKILGHSLNMWGAKPNEIIPTGPSVSFNQLLFKISQTKFQKQRKKVNLSHLQILELFELIPKNVKLQANPVTHISDMMLKKCFI